MSPIQKAWRGNTRVVIILAVSLIVRWALIIQGGQYYFPDEVRYLNSSGIAASILRGDFQRAFSDLTVSPEHIGYRIAAILPAIPEVLFDLGPETPAMFFSLFSVLGLFLVWKLAHRSGMSAVAADYALLVAASSTSLLYYTRHLLPYDLSLSFGLLALYIGLKKKWSVQNSLATGAVSFLCFIAYNGYWPLAGFVLLAHTLFNSKDISHSSRKALFFTLGVAGSLAVLTFVVSIGSGSNVISDYMGFAGSVTQGDYAEGWKLPVEYVWHAEHAILLLIGGLVLYALFKVPPQDRKTVNLWIGGSLFIYACLAIPSTVLQVFVVYGRTVRQIVPFLALLAGVGLAKLEGRKSYGKGISSTILVLILVQASWNIFFASSVTYPIEFIRQAEEQYRGFAMSQKRTNTGAPAVCQRGDFLAVHVKYIHPKPETVPAIQGDLLLSNDHPLNFLPYQYEGYTPEQRQVLRKERIEMKLYKINRDHLFNISGTPVPNCVAANP